MGAFQGGLTYRQYFVTDPLPEGWKDLFQAGIEKNVFRPIEIASDVERAIGWCSVHFPLDTELNAEMYAFNEYLVLAMRIDTLTVPGPLLRIHTEAEARRVMREQKRESLNRYERAEIKERVKLELRRRMMPTIKAIDMVWNWQTGVVRFFASNEKTNLEFMELFELTFERVLTPDAAYTAALYGMKLTDPQKEALEHVEPEPFVDVDTAMRALKQEEA